MRSAVLALLLTAPVCAADSPPSGPAVGQRPGPYSFLVATGPQRGQPTCYVCEQGDKPTAVVFARTLSNPLGHLLAKLDAGAGARKDTGFKAWATLLGGPADLNGLAKWAQKQGLKALPVGAFEDTDGPPAYRLGRDADIIVVLFVNRRVTASFAFRAGELTEAKAAEVLRAVPGWN